MQFHRTPSGNILALQRISDVRITDRGLLLLGSDSDDILDFIRCPPAVARAFRDAYADLLMSQGRPGRPARQPDWEALAEEADPDWTRQQRTAG